MTMKQLKEKIENKTWCDGYIIIHADGSQSAEYNQENDNHHARIVGGKQKRYGFDIYLIKIENEIM